MTDDDVKHSDYRVDIKLICFIAWFIATARSLSPSPRQFNGPRLNDGLSHVTDHASSSPVGVFNSKISWSAPRRQDEIDASYSDYRARLPQLTTVIAVALSLSSCSIVSSPGSDGTFELLILHNNDMHARFEQTSQLSGACTTADRDAGKCYVKEARKAAASGQGPPVLYLNAGDTYTGTAWFTIYKWKIAAEFLNALEPDAVSLGNHEFDNGISGLIPYIANLSCPTLAANLILDDEPELKAQEKLRNSVVFDINGVKIGVIGYLTPDTRVLSSKNNVKYIDEVTAIKDEVKKLNGEGVNILIALGHSGFLTDLKIAQEVNSIDLVIGGHTNTFLWNGKAPDSETPQGPYPKLVKQSSGREVPVVQAYAYTKYLGQLKIVFDSNGEIIGFNGNPILLNNSIPRDPDVVKIVEKYRENVMKVSEISVGSTAVLLDGSSCRLRECNMGNLITDALVYKYASDYQGVGWTDAPIAVMQGGGIRATINHVNDESDITQGDLLTVMPFDDRAVKVAMSGSDIRKMLEHSVAEYNVIRAPGQFLQFSGMKVEYDFQKKSGERVLRAQILCGDCILPEYSMLNDSAVYNILINGFLSMGGDGFSVFVDKPQDYLNFNDLSATIEYINKTSPIFPAIEGRIIIHNEMAISSAYTKTFSLTMLSCFIISLGNHEFDHGVSGLTPFIENLTSPVLAANLVLTKVPELEDQTNLRKSIVFNISETHIGVIGYLTPETKTLAVQNDVEYIDEIVALKKEVKRLKKEGVNIIIALGHSGYLKDLQIAKGVEGLNLVIGGHTNTFLWNGTSPDSEKIIGPYPTYVTQPSGKQVPVVQAYAYTKYLGKLHMVFNTNGDLIKADGNPVLLDNSIPQDPEVLSIIDKYREKVLNFTEEIIGNTTVVLDGLVTCQHKECNLGNLIADAMVYKYSSEYTGKEWTDAPIAIIQGGGIRSSISMAQKSAIVTKGDLITALPFEGVLVVVTMNGSILIQMLEHSVANLNDIYYPGEFLQVSGLKIVYDLKKPDNHKVVKAVARCWNCTVPKYTDVDVRESYNVIMPYFVANGGDGYWMLKGLPTRVLDYNELSSTITYFRKYSPVHPEIEGRITFLQKNKLCSLSNNLVSSTLLILCLGNHEFDEQVDGLLPFIRNLTSPVLAANLILDEVPLLEAETNLYKSIILQKNGVQIGVIGYVTPDTKFLAPKNKVKYEDEIPALRREVNKLKSHDVNIVIALGHSGFIKDLEIAAEVDGIDLVIGGHSNTFLTNKNTSEIPEFRQGAYPTTVIQKSGRKTLVVQAYAYTKYMGKLHLLFNDAGDIIDFNGEPILLNDLVPKDPEVLEIVNKYRGEVNRINNKIVGTSSVLLNGESCRLFECNLGNVMTDAMLDYTKRHAGFADVNIAVIQGGRIRSSINRSEKPFLLTRGDWINVMPFTDTLCIVSMNGSVLLKALEHSVDSWRRVDTPGQFLQASGLEVVYDLANLPGNRVVSAKSMCVDCTKVSDVQDDLQYKVIMSTFLSEGGDGYSIFENLEKEVLTYGEITCILDYLNKYSPIDPDIDGRIKVLNEDKVNDIYIIEPVNVGMPDRFLPSSTDKSQSTLEVIILSIVVSISCLCHMA
ncbi:unnamed protein product [Leptidea sinapis]|uniref:Protein 5NUC n=1 Tax=Leptidea sinapis TaxID=189913 RepID=A0A5E4Q672_9NEOP|nr:unnamed protein product [Leptidea sinapis]